MSATDGSQLKVFPDDSVMMALCKSLYDIAVNDIYVKWDESLKCFVPNKPTDTQKKERDAALRMVLERIGGRKTMNAKEIEIEEVEVAPWIAQLQESSL